MSGLRGVGREAEDRAADFLMGLGYTIVTRRYHTKGGEIDLVALDGDTLVFVEVKSTRARGFSPEEAIDDRKTARIAVAAEAYLNAMEAQGRLARFDLIAIDRSGLRHYVDAFR